MIARTALLRCFLVFIVMDFKKNSDCCGILLSKCYGLWEVYKIQPNRYFIDCGGKELFQDVIHVIMIF